MMAAVGTHHLPHGFVCHSTNRLFGIAVTPDEAAKSLIKFIETFDIEKTGEYWAPRGPR